MKTLAPLQNSTLVTADELLRLDAQGFRGELVRGVLREMNPAGQRHGQIIMRLGARLVGFTEQTDLGTVVGSDSGVWLERDPDTVREPDLAFTSVARLPPGQVSDGYAEVVPDLVVEVASPSDRRREVHDKAVMWLSFGVRLVWVIRPGTQTVDVHLAGQPVTTLADDESLDGGDVVPGFTYPLQRLFAP